MEFWGRLRTDTFYSLLLTSTLSFQPARLREWLYTSSPANYLKCLGTLHTMLLVKHFRSTSDREFSFDACVCLYFPRLLLGVSHLSSILLI